LNLIVQSPRLICVDDPRWDRRPPRGLWSFLIRHAYEDHTELRRWAAWVWWTREENQKDKLKRIVLGVRETFENARLAVKKYGRKVEAQYGVPRKRQLRQIVLLRLRYAMSVNSYYRFQLFRPERWERADQYLEMAETNHLLRVLRC
jgi:hypothetical protein